MTLMRGHARSFRAREISGAIAMRRQGKTVMQISRALHRHDQSVRRMLQREMGEEYWVLKRTILSAARHHNPVPPSSALADRDRRASAPRSLTAFLMGDPEIGRSAFERGFLTTNRSGQ